ncbi:GNAT family N-acetyltransferase [Ureibacillus sinduriensis]|uniref:Acetyltransferase n=1 Tax=Ureibacillus sinduriensis BLB-1 = JCM 15800 TaxID=1384057 RepID=A0A0A3IJ77_9BACL|nr:GNAT family N-acetyltransferase [Ureibacillus sinduriensis]KGR74927.1 acetyltransferase [Ureibacillus sinduriensis BLB-1 = JCM 15800]
MSKVKLIQAEETYNLRHRILRPHMELKDCMYDTDHSDGTFHVGAFVGNQLVSIASFNIEIHPAFPAKRQYRLRGMATLDEFRNLGTGRKIVSFAEEVIKSKEADLLWCNARTTVKEYYYKIGFQTYGDVFDSPSIGPHIVMYKLIK